MRNEMSAIHYQLAQVPRFRYWFFRLDLLPLLRGFPTSKKSCARRCLWQAFVSVHSGSVESHRLMLQMAANSPGLQHKISYLELQQRHWDKTRYDKKAQTWHLYSRNGLHLTTGCKTAKVGKSNVCSELLDKKRYLLLHLGATKEDFTGTNIGIHRNVLNSKIGRSTIARTPNQ